MVVVSAVLRNREFILHHQMSDPDKCSRLYLIKKYSFRFRFVMFRVRVRYSERSGVDVIIWLVLEVSRVAVVVGACLSTRK